MLSIVIWADDRDPNDPLWDVASIEIERELSFSSELVNPERVAKQVSLVEGIGKVLMSGRALRYNY